MTTSDEIDYLNTEIERLRTIITHPIFGDRFELQQLQHELALDQEDADRLADALHHLGVHTGKYRDRASFTALTLHRDRVNHRPATSTPPATPHPWGKGLTQ